MILSYLNVKYNYIVKAKNILASLRPLHWFKNILIFIPLFISHQFIEFGFQIKSILIFAAMCCVASAGYLFNDLFDVKSDERIPHKRARPFVSGSISKKVLIFTSQVLFALSILFAWLISWEAVVLILIYFLSSLGYSIFIKKIVILDIITIVYFYLLRIIIGLVVFQLPLSAWLLCFSFFFFLGLACFKRVLDLQGLKSEGLAGESRRAYQIKDIKMISAFGVGSGLLAVLVLILYINSPAVLKLYSYPQILWFLCLVLLFWNGRLWVLLRKKSISVDPIRFVVLDPVSLICASLVLVILFKSI